ncbi:conserved hypothetical protein [Aspergillus lentulus]|uniref:LITAF domain-containing protein n=1 Tax=Aspergillus lentulus TaxID=293939 RepID=A0ABQ0ZVE3_ASPLE|nr:conserved hypothetical protein [Aspergillus lentulus]GFF42245.1 conserved hypothetical protein [Aspergillus lentulus]GFF46432.1 conserved hypothetical protein [Aspergillus lentulus]GFF65599.1 conserved hypothetical protein [Aspergillus lentulus]
MDAEKINSTPVPAYEQHPSPEAHHAQAAPIVAAPPNTHIQPLSPLPKDYSQQQQQFAHPPAPEYYAAAPGMGHPSGYNTATPLHALQRGPTPVDCPVCGHREMTRAEAHSGNTTHGWAAVLCCCFCLGCIPYLMSSLKDVDHYCGKCGVMLATWHNSGRVDVHHAVRN